MKKWNNFINKLQKALMPIGDFLANEKHFSSISSGLMATVGLTLVGAIFQILASPPITAEIMQSGGLYATIFGGWYNFANAYKDILMIPFNMTVGLFSIAAVFSIAYQLAKKNKMDGVSSGIMALTVFLIAVAPATSYTLADGETIITALNANYLGGPGLFTAIIIALISVDIAAFCKKKNIVIKMPDAVPPFLAESFTAMIPLLINVCLVMGINIGLAQIDPQLNIPSAITNALATPLTAVNSIPGMLLVILFVTILWCFGVHGTMIVYPLLLPLMFEYGVRNAQLHAAGMPLESSPVFLFMAVNMIGGTGNTLGFTILSMFKAKSAQLKAVGKASFVPGIFGINEPTIFGAPIVYNPILMIPFVLGSFITGIILWAGFATGLFDIGYIMIMTALPIGLAGFMMAMSIKNFIFQIALIPLLMLIWYPFFKAYDNQLYMKEKEAEATEENSDLANTM